ncbi:MAG: 4-alpha-glucanotransferase, partial [Longimicrobiales bacterium]
LRDGRIREDDFDAADMRYHAFVQWADEQQISAIAHDPDAAALYLDMPLGVHPHGYDTWRHRALFAAGASAGAPPDALFRGGQDWGFPPMDPDALRADGYGYLIGTLRHQLRHARVLRLDHVMALYRLFWIPRGLPATHGVYIRYPEDEMFAVLTLESARHRAAIVGEDLGTVPAALRRRLDRHAIQRMFVVQNEVGAERNPPIGTPPARSAASLNTHDMPTFAGFWHGRDLTDLRDLSLVDGAGEDEARAERARLRSVLARHLRLSTDAARADAPGAAFDALLDYLANGRSSMVIIGLEDLWLEDRPQNVPGTRPEQRPNWRRRFRYPFPDILRRPKVQTRLARFAASRARAAHMNQEQE